MAFKSSATNTSYTFNGNTIKLSARFSNLQKLKEATGVEPFAYIGQALDLNDPDACVAKLTTLFVNLQQNEDEHSESDIRDGFFGNFSKCFTEENIVKIATMIGHLLGQDLSEKLAEVQSKASEGDPKKA